MPAIDIEPAGTPDRPFSHGGAVTPSDTLDLPFASRGFHISKDGAGDVKITTLAGETFTLFGAASGYHPWRVTRFWATGTTATGITVGW